MTRTVLIFASLIALSVVGCESSSSQKVAPPVTPPELWSIRSEYMQTNPNARVALVTGVLPATRLISAQFARENDFSLNDTVMIIDSNRKLIAHGTVTESRGTDFTVTYLPVPVKQTLPATGDIVIRFAR